MLKQMEEAMALFHSDQKKFWKKLRGQNVSLPTPLQSPEVWKDFMCKLSTLGNYNTPVHQDSLSQVAYPVQATTPAQSLNQPFSQEEVEEGLLSLKNGKASGFLGYPAEFLKYAQKLPKANGVPSPHILSRLIQDLLNAIFYQGRIPVHHNTSTIAPTLKDSKGDILDTGNYRPLAVPEPLMKLYATLIDKRVVQHLDEHGFRCEAQTSFRKGLSTLHSLFTLQHFIDRATLTEPLYVCKLDLSKAYDRVPRELLWEALRRVGIQGECLQAIKALYEDARLTVGVGATYGEYHTPQAGITQGSPLSPTIWSIIADGLIRYIHAKCPHIGSRTRDGLRVSILMFADDIKLLATTHEDLQTLLDVVKEWCDLMNMVVNELKTHVLIFPEHGRPTLVQFHYDGKPLDIVPSTKYLGILFSSKNGIGETFQLLHKKMWGAWTSVLRRYGNLQSSVSIGLILRLLLTCVVPAGSYACELWSVLDIPNSSTGMTHKALETDFRSMLRMVVGAGNTVSQEVLLEELGLHPVRHHWMRRVVTFWNSLVKLPETHMYARILKDSCYFGVTTHNRTWAGSVMRMLRSIGYPYDIDCNQAHPIDLEVFKSVLQQQRDKAWGDLNLSPRLGPSIGVQRCTYLRWFARPSRVSKHRLLYLSISVRKLRLFLRFRMGQHDLPIVTGRWRGIPRHERFCDMCSLPLVGDEQHFVFYCPYLHPVRDRYMDLFRSPFRSLRQFIWQDNTPRVINFLVECLELRKLMQ